VHVDGLIPVRVLDILGSNPPGVLYWDGGRLAKKVAQPFDGQLIFVERDSKDFQRAGVAWVRREAERGDSTAQCALAWMYANHKFVARDDEVASSLYLKAAEAGDAVAQYYLGCRHEQGLGLPVNLAEAARWYEAAARQGIAPALCNLADKYERGAGVPQDLNRAFEMYREAAKNGVVAAMAGLAGLYRDGRGVARDEAQAALWMAQARARGYRE
jgi:TPR repeat protein